MNWNSPPLQSPTKLQTPFFVNEEQFKKAFAAELLKLPNEPFKAALNVFGADSMAAMHAANYWVFDPIVKAEQDRLLEEQGEDAFLPTKPQIARELYELSQRERLTQADKLRIDALNSYAKLMGWISDSAKINNNVKAGAGSSVQVVASDLDEKL